MAKLEKLLIKAITNNNAEELERLINICDLLHRGAPSYEGFTEKDIPDDMKYEEAKEKLKDLRKLEIAMTIPDKESITDKIKKKRQENILLYMDGIQSPQEIPTLSDVILMPKFDGCSIGVEITKNFDNSFSITTAHTRGSDSLTGKRKCQNKTELISKIFSLETFNKLYKEHLEEEFPLEYKDETLIGNNNPILKTKILLANIDKIIIRGEFVNKDRQKLPEGISTNIGLAAGTINANDPQYLDYLEFCPFEISSIIIKEVLKDDSVNFINYIPTQNSALIFLSGFKLIHYLPMRLKQLTPKINMENLFKRFLSQCKEPLDGIVYCNSSWTYPKIADETNKRVNYGKYKWKPHNAKHSRVVSVEYSIGKTGRIVPTIIYEPIKINDKTYTKSKTTFTHIKEFGENLGHGTICEIELRQDISPYISKIFPEESKVTELIKIPSICPWCKSSLVYSSTGKDLLCVNDKCPGMNNERCCDFLKQIGYKGVSTKTLENLKIYLNKDEKTVSDNKTQKVIPSRFSLLYSEKLRTEEFKESGVAVKRSIKYTAKKTPKTDKKKIDFDNIIDNLTVGDFLVASSLMTKKKSEEWLTKNEVSRSVKLLDYIKDKNNLNILKNIGNYFTNDFLEWITNN